MFTWFHYFESIIFIQGYRIMSTFELYYIVQGIYLFDSNFTVFFKKRKIKIWNIVDLIGINIVSSRTISPENIFSISIGDFEYNQSESFISRFRIENFEIYCSVVTQHCIQQSTVDAFNSKKHSITNWLNFHCKWNIQYVIRLGSDYISEKLKINLLFSKARKSMTDWKR